MAQSMVIEEKGTTRCRSGAWPGGPVFLCHICALGSTYFAIRVLVETAPRLFAAGVRFAIAGLLLYGWSRFRHVRAPARVEWGNMAWLGAFMFLAAYGGLFWAEKTIPSGVASVLVLRSRSGRRSSKSSYSKKRRSGCRSSWQSAWVWSALRLLPLFRAQGNQSCSPVWPSSDPRSPGRLAQCCRKA